MYIKNMPQEQITSLVDQVSVQVGQVVSKTLVQNDAVSVTIFAFAKGEEISSHSSKGDAMVTILEGSGKCVIDNQEYILQKDQTIIMPANKPHSVYGEEAFKMLLTVIFPK